MTYQQIVYAWRRLSGECLSGSDTHLRHVTCVMSPKSICTPSFFRKYFIIITYHTSLRHPCSHVNSWLFIFRKRATNYRALLQQMTYGDKASYGSSQPCSQIAHKSSNERLRHSFEDATHILSIDMTHPMGVCPPIIRVSEPFF